MDYISLGRRVNKRRRELHMTQEQLAEKLKLSTSFLGHIERGTRKASLETLIALCNALNVSPNYLLERSLTLSNPDLPPLSPEYLSSAERKKMRQIVESFSHWLEDPDELKDDASKTSDLTGNESDAPAQDASVNSDADIDDDSFEYCT